MVPKEVKWSKVGGHKEVYFFIIPTVVFIGLFQYYPAASGIVHSFFRWNGADISEYVGWQNYIDLVTSIEFWDSFKVAFVLGAWNVFKMIPALLVAVCIHRCRSDRLQFWYRVLFVVPMVIPPLVMALIWRSFFFEATSGYLNRFLSTTGLYNVLISLDRYFEWGSVFAAGKQPAWLGDPRLILTACIVWGFPWVGSFAVLTHLAKLQGIEKQIYEAGDIDGVGWWSKFRHIELPLITGSIYILLVFTIIGTIKDAGMILALAGIEGGPGGKVTVPALFMIRKAFLDQRMGYACAVGIVLTAVVMSLQKLSTAAMMWEGLKRWQQAGYRLALGVAGGTLLYLDRFVPMALGLILLAIPYRSMRNGAARYSPRFILAAAHLPHRVAETFRRRVDVRRETRALRFARDRILLPSRRERLGQWCGRGAKHLFIWCVLLFAFLPVYLMLIVSVKDNQQFYEKPTVITEPVHWTNWATAWESVRPTVANSVFISTSATALTLLFALAGAYFFARVKMPLSGLFWNAVLILMMMPTIANLVPLFRLLGTLGLLNTLTALILVGASAGQVMGIFVLRTFIADIPQDLFEAAEIDGASHFRQLRHVVIPLSGPILGTVGVMHFITQWNEFILPLIVMRDHARLPVMVQLLRMDGEYIKFWGPLMAGYAIASVPVIVLFAFSMRLFIRGMTEGAIKN